jgi:hypothetical protein
MARSQELSRLFQHPESTAQRHYEICRAYFLENLTADAVAERFQLQVSSIRTLVQDFAHHPDLGQFFRTAPAADKPAPKREAIRDRACGLRRQGRTLAEIRTQLHTEGHTVSEAYLFRIFADFRSHLTCLSAPQLFGKPRRAEVSRRRGHLAGADIITGTPRAHSDRLTTARRRCVASGQPPSTADYGPACSSGPRSPPP